MSDAQLLHFFYEGRLDDRTRPIFRSRLALNPDLVKTAWDHELRLLVERRRQAAEPEHR
jgi:hypothetical protein